MAESKKKKYDKSGLTEEQYKQLREELTRTIGISNRFYKQVTETVLQVVKSPSEALLAFANNWQSQINESLKELWESAATIQNDAKIAAPLLVKAGFWFTPSMPFELLLKVENLAKNEGALPEEIEKTIIEYYEDGNWTALTEMVDSWYENEHFANRKHIINDALDAHKAGRYTLSIPTLIPQIEGLLSSIFKQPAGGPTEMFKNALEKEYTDLLYEASKEILLSLATSPVLYGGIAEEYFIPERYPDWLNQRGYKEEQVFNRAAISHGIQINYSTKSNSVRVFLLLDIVYWITRKIDLT
jgi:hypothetical protein